jgi:hypothetical protein
MSAATANPRAFSSLRSEFNEFLYAPIGEERNDTLLTVLSALARLGLDPWQESARLAQLSRQMATQSLTATIAALPNGRWAPSESPAIAARLVALLPAKGFVPPQAPKPQAGRLGSLQSKFRSKFQPPTRIKTLLISALLGGMIFLTVTNLMHRAAPTAPDQPPASATNGPAG